MTDGQAARPPYVSLDTPHGRLELTWPQPQQVNAEGLEPVAAIMQQDPAPTARLNGTLITIARARQIVAGMRRTAEGKPVSADVPRYEITAGDVTVEAVVIQVDGKTIVQPVGPLIVHAGESFTISEGARTVELGGDGTPDGETGKGVTGDATA